MTKDESLGRMEIAEDIFLAHRSRKRALALLAVLLALSAFLLLVPVEVSERLEFMARIVGGVGLLTCVIGVASALRKPTLDIRVSSAGIFYRPWSDQTVPWDQITRITERRINIQRILCLHLKDPKAFKTKAYNRLTTRLNKSSGDFGDINVMPALTDRTLDELKFAVSAHMEIEAGA